MIYIAQPPLYEIKVKGKKKSEYILSENQMHKRMIGRGLEGTELVIRSSGKGKKPRKISGEKLADFVKLLADAERIIAVLSRRGIKFGDFVQTHYNGKGLPMFRIQVEGEEEGVDSGPAGETSSTDPLAGLSDAGAAHVAQIQDVLRAVEENRDPELSGEEARKAVAIVLAIYESARAGRPAAPQ